MVEVAAEHGVQTVCVGEELGECHTEVALIRQGVHVVLRVLATTAVGLVENLVGIVGRSEELRSVDVIADTEAGAGLPHLVGSPLSLEVVAQRERVAMVLAVQRGVPQGVGHLHVAVVLQPLGQHAVSIVDAIIGVGLHIF